MTGIFIKALMKGGSKVSPTIKSVKPGTGLTTKRAIQDKTVKAVDEGTKKGMKEAGADSKFFSFFLYLLLFLQIFLSVYHIHKTHLLIF